MAKTEFSAGACKVTKIKEERGSELAVVLTQLLVEKNVLTDKEIDQGLEELSQIDKCEVWESIPKRLRERWLRHGENKK